MIVANSPPDGSKVWGGGLFQDGHVERLARDDPLEPRVLGLQVLEPFRLIDLEIAVLTPPSVVVASWIPSVLQTSGTVRLLPGSISACFSRPMICSAEYRFLTIESPPWPAREGLSRRTDLEGAGQKCVSSSSLRKRVGSQSNWSPTFRWPNPSAGRLKESNLARLFRNRAISIVSAGESDGESLKPTIPSGVLAMKKIAIIAGTVCIGLGTIVVLSNRTISEMLGYARAAADQTVDGLEENLPDAVRDQKLRNDLNQARGAVIDRRVQLNLAETQLDRIQADVEALEEAVNRRDLILSEAYPALQSAASDPNVMVTFVGTTWEPTELESEVDRLLTEQERDQRQLAIRREALSRLAASVSEGAAAVAKMETQLVEAEHEFEVLVARREQAHSEGDLLDLVASIGSGGNSTEAQIGDHLERLRGKVERLEAGNEARRETAQASDGSGGRLTQAWERLERLKELHESRAAKTEVSQD